MALLLACVATPNSPAEVLNQGSGIARCESSGQQCDTPVFFDFEPARSGTFVVSVGAFDSHCSAVSFALHFDGDLGQRQYRTGELQPGETHSIRIDDLTPGYYFVHVSAEGWRGGCNNGELLSWGVDWKVEEAP